MSLILLLAPLLHPLDG
uniref:Uncharacterized protein n=1 Tax=Musa acuminata subsp. malaccensis TaxID=214687 RepID=A0A804JDK6_MUSAM